MTDEVAELVVRLHIEQPDLVLVGEVLSLAAYVEPALLRRARLEFAPRSTAELEGRFWFSPLVESAGPDHLHLDPAFAEVLRGRLAARPDSGAARELIRSAHEHADPAVVLFESLVWAGLAPGADPSRVAEPLLQLATTMAEDPERAADVARWTLRYVPRLPAALRDTDCAIAVRLLAASKLGVQVSVPSVTAGAAGLVGGLASSTSDRTESFGLRLTSHGVVISSPPEPDAEVAELSAPGRIVRVAAPGGGLARHVQVTPGVPVEVGFGYLALVAADGRVLRTVTLPGHIVDLAADQELRTVAVGFADGEVRYGRWADDPAEWTRVVREELGPIAVSPDGERIAMACGASVEVASLSGGSDPHPVGGQVVQLFFVGKSLTAVAEGDDLWLVDLDGSGARLQQEIREDLPRDPALVVRRGERIASARSLDFFLQNGSRWLEWHLPRRIRAVALMGRSGTPLAAVVNTHGLIGLEPLGRTTVLPLDFMPRALVGLANDTVLVAGSAGPLEISGRAGSRATVLLPQVVAERRAAEPTPAWYRTAVFYELLVAKFQDSNGDGVGDLAGVTERLDYLRWLGVDCVSLGPIQAKSDPRTVDERYGTIGDLVNLVDQAHQRGLRVVAELAVERGYVSDPLEQMLNTVWFWLDLGLDGIRIADDFGPFDSHTFRQRAIGDHPDRVLIMGSGERTHVVEEEGVLSLDTRLALQLFMAVARESRFPMPMEPVQGFFLRDREMLSLKELIADERILLYGMYARDPRMAESEGIRRRLAPLLDNDRKQVELLLSLLFSLAEAPFLYYGDEIGMGDNIWLPDSDSVRTPMQWNSDRNAGFSNASPGRMIAPVVSDPVYGYDVVNVESQRSDENSLLHSTRRLIEARKSYRAFSTGRLINLAPSNPAVLAYLRVDREQVVLCVANLSARFQSTQLDLSAYSGRVMRDLLAGEDSFPIDPLSITLSGHDFLWVALVEAGGLT